MIVSHNGMMLLQCLRKIADSGCCVMLSIHHPNIPMFESLDHVFVIHQGRSFFQCDKTDVRQYFETRGVPVPSAENPADHMLTVTQTYTAQDLEDRGFFKSHTTFPGEESDVTQDNSEDDDDGALLSPQPAHGPTTNGEDDRQHPKSFSAIEDSFAQLAKKHPTSLWMETKNLLLREFRRTKRDKAALYFRAGLSLLGGVFGIVFHGVADATIDSPLDFTSHVGAMFFFFNCGFILSPSLVIEYIESRPMYDREFRTGHYHIASLAVVNALRELLIIVMQIVFTSLITFWSIGFQGRFWYLCFAFIFNVFSVISGTKVFCVA